MRQQLADGNVLLAVLREVREISGDGIVEADAALLDKLHHRGCRSQALGERGQVEDGVQGHGLTHGLE